MAENFPTISDKHRAFIERQTMYFVASAAPTGRVNLSPKGMDTFRVLSPTRVAYLDLTGSGNETSAHVEACADHRLTLMFCAFEGPPQILRLYGRGQILRLGTADYEALLPQFPEIIGSRQIVALDVERVQTSCGYGVPLYDYRGQRPSYENWCQKKGEEGLDAYRREKNVVSIDGLPTGWPRD